MKISGCHRSEHRARDWLRIRCYISTVRNKAATPSQPYATPSTAPPGNQPPQPPEWLGLIKVKEAACSGLPAGVASMSLPRCCASGGSAPD